MMPGLSNWKNCSLQRESSRWSEYFSVPIDEKSSDTSSEQDMSLLSPQIRTTRMSTISSWRSCIPRLSYLLNLILIIALTAVSTLHIRLLRELSPPAPEKYTCGASFEEAKSLGCEFDQLVKTWLPPQCSRYGLEEYLEAGHASVNQSGMIESGDQWPYWHDREMTQPIPVGELAFMAREDENGPKWWTTGREHMTHCTWMIIRLAYVYSHGERTDILTSQFHHAKHCALFMLDRALEGPNVDEVRTVGNTMFGWC